MKIQSSLANNSSENRFSEPNWSTCWDCLNLLALSTELKIFWQYSLQFLRSFVCIPSTLNSGSLKLVDKFMYLRSSVSSTENDINLRLATGYRSHRSQTYLTEFNVISSKQWMYQYYCMDAPHRRWLGVQRKFSTGTTQERYMLY